MSSPPACITVLLLLYANQPALGASAVAQINHANSAALFIPHPEPLYHASHLVQFDVEVPLLPLIKGCNLLLTRVGTFSNVLYTNSVVNKWNDSSSTVLLQARASSMTQILHSACEKIMLPFPHPSQTKFVAMSFDPGNLKREDVFSCSSE